MHGQDRGQQSGPKEVQSGRCLQVDYYRRVRSMVAAGVVHNCSQYRGILCGYRFPHARTAPGPGQESATRPPPIEPAAALVAGRSGLRLPLCGMNKALDAKRGINGVNSAGMVRLRDKKRLLTPFALLIGSLLVPTTCLRLLGSDGDCEGDGPSPFLRVCNRAKSRSDPSHISILWQSIFTGRRDRYD